MQFEILKYTNYYIFQPLTCVSSKIYQQSDLSVLNSQRYI